MAKNFDVVVIGAGPGGQIAAIRAAQLGFNVACVDEWKNEKGGPAPGGTCTNVGCIPSKALLQSSEHFEHAGHSFAAHGIGVEGLTIDVPRMLARKASVIKQNNDGILYLFKKNKVTFLHGRGSFAGGDANGGYQIAVAGKNEETITAKHVIVATGSTPRALPGTQAALESGTPTPTAPPSRPPPQRDPHRIRTPFCPRSPRIAGVWVSGGSATAAIGLGMFPVPHRERF